MSDDGGLRRDARRLLAVPEDHAVLPHGAGRAGRPRRRSSPRSRTWRTARTRRATRARSRGSLYCGDHDHYALPRRGVQPLLARQRAAARHVPERDEVRGRDHRDDLATCCTAPASASSPAAARRASSPRCTPTASTRARRAASPGPTSSCPTTAHVALDKGAHWMGIEVRHAPLTDGYVADVAAMADAHRRPDHRAGRPRRPTTRTASSTRSRRSPRSRRARHRHARRRLPRRLAAAVGREARVRRAAVGLPGARRHLDLAPTPTSTATRSRASSVLLYRSKDLRKNQYFTYPDWPGGLYLSPGLAGSRSGGIIASTYAAILATGESRLPRRRRRHHAHRRRRSRTASAASIPELEVIGDPTFLVALQGASTSGDSTSTSSTTRSRPRAGG